MARKSKPSPKGKLGTVFIIFMICVVLYAIKYFWPLLVVLIVAYLGYVIYRLKHPKEKAPATEPEPVPVRVSTPSISLTTHEPTPQDFQAQRYDEVQRIRELQKASLPSKNGLYPHEILMLSYADKYATDQTEFPQFWYYQYAVSDPAGLLRALKDKGFIRPASAKEALPRLTIPQLKEIIEAQGLKASGKKADLISFISANIDTAVLEAAIPDRKYAITALGESELEGNAYIPYLHSHKNLNVSMWDINKAIQNYPPNLWRDCVWAELQRQSHDAMTQIQNGNWGPYILIGYQQADFLAEEGKAKDALHTLLIALHDQLIHVSPKYFLLEIELREKEIKTYAAPAFSEIVLMDDYGFKKISQALEKFDIDAAARKPLLLDLCNKEDMTKTLFPNSAFVDLVLAYVDGNSARFSELCDVAQNKLLNKS